MGILTGTRVVELAGLGPAAWTTTFLSDMGAEVVRIDRPGRGQQDGEAAWLRGRSRLELDLRDPEQLQLARDLLDRADVLIEAYRPGVAERLGLGPEECRSRNPRLVYARLTGWGQDGPYAQRPGHDLNFLSITGVLDTLGPVDGPPIPSLYYVGDWGSGTMLLLSGVLGALLERERSGLGQVVDASIVDGASLMLLPLLDQRAAGQWTDARGINDLDGGAWYYGTYPTADGRYMALAAYEPTFRRAVLRVLGVPDDDGRVLDRERWPEVRAEVAAAFRGRTQAAWESVFDGVDACVTPVRSLAEALEEPHLRARGTYPPGGGHHAAPAPRFSRTPSRAGTLGSPFDPAAWGIDPARRDPAGPPPGAD